MENQDARFLDLLRKWQSGDFTRSDERELDALTQGDDFRRETWEGFTAQPEAEHEQRLAALRLRLRLRAGLGQTRRIGPLPMMMAAAAAVALLVVAVLFFGKKGRQPDAPLSDMAAAPVAAEQAAGTVPADTAEASNFAANEERDRSAQLPATRRSAGTAATSAAPGAAAGTALADDVAAAPPPITEVASAERTESESAPNDRIASQSTVIVPPPTEAKNEQPADRGAADKQAEAVTAVPEKKKATTSPAAKPVQKTPVASKPDTAWNKTGVPPDMVKRRKEAREAELPAQSEPSTGWDAFQEYLRQTARLTPAARSKGVSGTVRLRFTVSENGDPQGFVTLRSVGYGCDQEAVRLVKDWVWVRGQNPTVIVEIPFVK